MPLIIKYCLLKISSRICCCHCKASLNDFWAVFGIQRGPSWLELGQCCPDFQEEQGEWPQKLQISQSHFSVHWNHGKSYSGSSWKTPGGWLSHWSQQTWLHERKVLLFEPGIFLVLYNLPCWSKKPADVIFLDISEAFYIISHRILLDKMDSHVKWCVNNWFTGQAQRVTVNRVTSDWWSLTSGVPEGFILSPVLFHIFIKGLDEELEEILNLLIILNWENLLTPPGAQSPCRETSRCWRDGQLPKVWKTRGGQLRWWRV